MNDDEQLEKLKKLSDEDLLHLIPQETWHAPATIRGSRASFKKLAFALNEASKKQDGSKSKIMMTAADGEGYYLEMEPVGAVELANGPWPYAQLGHPWDYEKVDNPGGDRLAYCDILNFHRICFRWCLSWADFLEPNLYPL